MKGRKVKQNKDLKEEENDWDNYIDRGKRWRQPSKWSSCFMRQEGSVRLEVRWLLCGLGLTRLLGWAPGRVDRGVLDGNQCWLLRNVQRRKELQNSPTAQVLMPHSCSCSVRISSSIPPVTSSQHQSCLSQQLEMPLSKYNCISAERPQSQWIIWHHRPWWIISDHMPLKTHIPY